MLHSDSSRSPRAHLEPENSLKFLENIENFTKLRMNLVESKLPVKNFASLIFCSVF